MSDLLSIAASGARAYARALETVADNVANSATPGHVRRSAALAPAGPAGGNGPLELDPDGGNGVRVTAILRATDLLRTDSLRRSEGTVAMLDTAARWTAEAEALVGSRGGVGDALDGLFGGLADLAADPTSLAARATVLRQADTLAERFRRTASDLDRLAADLGASAATEVRTLNGLSQALADLNAQLRRATAGGAAAAVLADDRDRVLAQLASITSIDVRIDARGQADVRVGDPSGPLLVAGGQARSARLVDAGGVPGIRIGPEGADEPASPGAGTLAGVAVAAAGIAAARSRLDALATDLVGALNQAHERGVSLDGAAAGPLFDAHAVAVVGAAANGGRMRLMVERLDDGPPPPLRLRHDAVSGLWTLERPDGSDPVTGPLPLSLAGLRVDGSGVAANGDVFHLRPVTGAAAIALAIDDPRLLATAPAFVAEPLAGNAGTGTLQLAAAARSDPPAPPPFAVALVAADLVEVRDALDQLIASGPPGQWIDGDGFRLRLEGAPAVGDSFAILPSPFASGDPAVALALLAARDSLSGGATPGERWDALVAAIAVPLADMRTRLEGARSDREAAAIALQESAGVDLNAEAAEMLRLQQAYQASARIIQTARAIFEALLAAAR